MANQAAYDEAMRLMEAFDAWPTADKKWSHGKAPDKGNGTAEEIFLAVGKALSAWENFESGLTDLFLLFISSRSNEAAQHAFGYIGTSRGKFNALAGAFTVFARNRQLDADDRRRFDKLMRHFIKAAYIRNDIAHATVTSVATQDVDRGYFLVPAPHDSEKNDPLAFDGGYDDEKPFDGWGWKFRFDAAAVSQYAAGFGELWSATQHFRFALGLEPK